MINEKILVVDDDDDHREAIQFILEEEGYSVITAESGTIGLKQLKTHDNIRVLIVDLAMKEISGVELLKQIKDYGHSLRRIVLTAHEDELPFQEAKELDVFSYLNKPISNQPVLFTVKSAFNDLSLKKLEKELGIAKQWEELGQITQDFVKFVVDKLRIIPNHIETITDELSAVPGSVQSEFHKINVIIDEIIELKEVLSTTFARTEKEEADVNGIIDLTINLIHTFPEDIEIIKNYCSKGLISSCNSKDLIQVLKAVIVNAIDAMQGTKTKELTISTSESQDETVQITIHDTGCGILEENKNKIFRAFYTTKKERNFGLGLFLAKNTLAKFDGTIKFQSNKDEGTSFVVNLPLFKK